MNSYNGYTQAYTNEGGIYSFCITNANVFLACAMDYMEQYDEHNALREYASYVWWMDFARAWMKGKRNA